MARKNGILTYRTEATAKRAIKRLTKRYPIHPAFQVKAVISTHWQYPFRWLISVTGPDGRVTYWPRS